MSIEDGEVAMESTPLLPKNCPDAGEGGARDQAAETRLDESQPSLLASTMGLNPLFTQNNLRLKASYAWCSVFSAMLMALLVVILIASRRPTLNHEEGATLSSTLKVRREDKRRSLPHPPQLYEYSGFLSWLDQQDFEGYGFKLVPKRSWFDAEKAMESFPQWFTDQDMNATVEAFQGVDRWSFMKNIMQTGHEEIQAAVAPHLLTMRWFQDSLVTAHTVVDMGCGTGVLLRYLQVFAKQLGNDKLRAIGFDSDLAVVQLADALAKAESTRVPGLTNPWFFSADMYRKAEVKQALAHPEPSKPLPFSNFSEFNYDPVHRIDLVVIGAALGGDVEYMRNETKDDRALRIVSKGPLEAVWERMPLEGLAVVPICKELLKTHHTCKADLYLVGKDQYEKPKIVHGAAQDTEFDIWYKAASDWGAASLEEPVGLAS